MGKILTGRSLDRIEYRGALAASKLNNWLENRIGHLEAAAEDMIRAIESNNFKDLERIVESHYQNCERHFLRLYFGCPDGNVWLAGGQRPERDRHAGDQPWYAGAVKKQGKIAVSEPRRDPGGNFYIAFSKAIIKNGKLVAVAGTDIDLNTIRQIMNENPVTEDGFTFLVAEDTGSVLVHPDGNIPEMVCRDMLKTNNGESVSVARLDGTQCYCNSHRIPLAGWRLFSAVDGDAIRGPVKRHTRFEIALSLAIFAMICALLCASSRAMGKAARTEREHSNMKSVFLANMSHEIRTPMNSIIGFAELALENSDTANKTKGYLENIRDSAKDLLSIINNILDISKIEAGKLSLETVPFSLRDVFTACENTIGLKAAEKGLKLDVYFDPAIEDRLLGDPAKLRQILLNLLSNAVKFTHAGTVKLTAAVERKTPGEVVLRFEVKDSGIGMTAAQISRIFRSFEQGDSSITRKYGGTGLGLSITKDLVELMGGKLSVDSAPGIGSIFAFVLEFKVPGEKEETREKEQPAARPLLFSGRVLICEDNLMNQEVIRDHLERMGVRADIREDGKQGLEAVRESLRENRPYDLILMDIHMPVMDGLEASMEIKRLGCATPVIALTASVLTRDTDTYYRYGIAGCLGKPFTSRELRNCLLRHLKPLSPDSGTPEGEEGRIIDRQAELGISGGNGQLREKLHRDFYTQNRNFFEKFSALLEQAGNPETGGESIPAAHRMAHTLKSSAALIGAKKLSAAAGEMEAALRAGKAAYSREQLEALRETLEATFRALEREGGTG
jgi:signal transduction histidine kinase/DNA-binding response OmpR family regulator